MADWLFTSDLHGQTALYEQALALAAAHAPRALLLGGDLAPHGAGLEGLARQRLFFAGFFVEFARRLREASPGTRLFVLMGNDDWADNSALLEREHGGLWHVMHERVTELDGWQIAGCSWVPITPFTMKDWDRWEDGGEEQPARLEGLRSRAGALEPCRFDPAHRAPTIAESLHALGARLEPARCVLVSHSPPRDTHCDVTMTRQHVGSRALRAFVAARQPALVLSGHIHESARQSNAWHDRIGGTPVVNPGQFGTSRLCAVWFDPGQVGDTLRHTVHD